MTRCNFLNSGGEIWAPCYNCKTVIELVVDPKLWVPPRSKHMGAVFTHSSKSVHPRIKNHLDFDALQDIVSCVKCIGEYVIDLADDMHKRCDKCGKYYNDSDIELDDNHLALGFAHYSGTSFDTHKAYCIRTTRNAQAGYRQWDATSHTWSRPKPKPRNAFLIRRQQL